MENKEQKILKTAEKMVRAGGYNAFSFREIAKEVGIKSSSVHYYFSTKAELGAALAQDYTDKFLSQLGDPAQLIANQTDPIKIYIKSFYDALTKDKRMCLCGMLGAEVNGLPPEVAAQTKAFFERNIEWLKSAYTLKGEEEHAETKALRTVSLLEGAMILSNVLETPEAFMKATGYLSSV